MKKAVMVFAILSASGQIRAQIREIPENKKIMLGFNIGLNYSNVMAPGKHSCDPKVNNGGGFRVGVIMSEEINKKMSISPKAELSFNDCNIVYSSPVSSESKYLVYPVNIDLMIHLCYKLKKGKYEPYLLAGPNAKIPLVESKTNTKVYGNNPDFAIDIGFGLEKAMDYFHLAPELRYSIGLLNVNRDPSLDRVYFHNITFVLNLKG